MTERKKQHFVPQFYLRNFSNDQNGRNIGLYNLNSSKYIPTTLIKNQSCRDFFYGKDGTVEEGLSQIESILAPEIKNVIDNESLPVRESDAHIALLIFIVISDLRNPISIENSQKFVQLLNQEISKKTDNKVTNYVPEIPHEMAVELSFLSYPEILPLCLDLHYKLLCADKGVFLTSDYPVVKYNQFLETKIRETSCVGYAALGLLIFFPISPKMCLMLYDPNIYKAGNRKSKVLRVKNDDVLQLNQLQLLNCSNNVYFNQDVDEEKIQDIINNVKTFKKRNEPMLSVYDLVKNGMVQKNEQIFHFRNKDLKIGLKLSFLKYIRKANGTDIKNHAVPMRPKAKLIVMQRNSE